MGAPHDWPILLQKIGCLYHDSGDDPQRWFTNSPANLREISESEDRLHHAFPESYKRFLLTTDGCGAINSYIWKLLPVEEVDFCLRKTPDFFAGFIDPNEAPISDSAYASYGSDQLPEIFRSEYIKHSLQVSEVGDSAAIILNPVIQDYAGEWEAWIIGTWFPGAIRYPSFWELMAAQVST